MLIGIDAGGSKTDICVTSDSGRVVSRTNGPGVNAARMGVDAAAMELFAQIRHALPACTSPVSAIYVGAAGAGSPEIASALQHALYEYTGGMSPVRVDSDAFNAMDFEVGLGDGAALIAGTGSSAFTRIGGSVFQVGGRGYLVDDAGSGYSVGRACLNAAYRELDGRGPRTLLTGLAEEMLGMSIKDAIPVIYEGGTAYIASFSPLAFKAAQEGDSIATEIAENCAAEIVLLMKICAEKMNGVCAPMVASGGLMRVKWLTDRLVSEAEKLGLQMIICDRPPVLGAVVAAADMAGFDRLDTFRAELSRSLYDD